MDFKSIIRPLLRMWWLLIIAAALATIGSYFLFKRQPVQYSSHTTLMVGNTLSNPNPDSSQLYLAQQLAGYYADLANRDAVQRSVLDALKLSKLPQYTSQALSNTQLIQITVLDTDPKLAASVANEIANQLILRSPTSNQSSQERSGFINQQLDTIQTEIPKTQADLRALNDKLASATSARDLSNLQTQIAALETKLQQLQQTYGTLVSSTQQGAINTLNVIESAQPASQPVKSNLYITLGLAAAIGLVLAGLSAYLIDYIDGTIRTAEEVSEILKLPISGEIGFIPGETPYTYVAEEPMSVISGAMRMLRFNLELLLPQAIHTIMVTSPESGEGKTTISANLAAIFAQSKRKVVLVETDFYRPKLQKQSGIEENTGLADVLAEEIPLFEALHPWEQLNISIIPTGTTPDNPHEMLFSQKMDLLIDDLKKQADVIIFDCPPLFVPDSYALAKKVDCVLLVVKPGQTQRNALKKMRDQMAHLNVQTAAIVLNQVKSRQNYYQNYARKTPGQSAD
jgi:polysaccharide biosynthesis transport protein